MVKDSNTRIIVTIAKDTKEKLDKYKDFYHLSTSAVVQYILLDYFKMKGEYKD